MGVYGVHLRGLIMRFLRQETAVWEGIRYELGLGCLSLASKDASLAPNLHRPSGDPTTPAIPLARAPCAPIRRLTPAGIFGVIVLIGLIGPR